MADMKKAMGGANFPKPSINSVNEDDPMIERIPTDKMDIGARASGLPKSDVTSTVMGIEHVGGGKK